MTSSGHARLAGPESGGGFLGEHLRQLWLGLEAATSKPEPEANSDADLRLVLRDGCVAMHRGVWAAASVSALGLQASWLTEVLLQRDKEPATVLLPDFSVRQGRLLRQLLYCGRTRALGRAEEEASLGQLARAAGLTVASSWRRVKAAEEDDSEAEAESEEAAEDVTIPLESAAEDEESPLRRSERPRAKNHRYASNVAKRKRVSLCDKTRAPQQEEEKGAQRSKKPRDKDFPQFAAIELTDQVLEEVRLKSVSVDGDDGGDGDGDGSALLATSWPNNFGGARDATAAGPGHKICYVCRRQFLGLHAFTKHLRTHGPGQGPYACHLCRREVQHGLGLHDHMRGHYKGRLGDDGAEERLACRRRGCRGRTFRSRAGLVKHLAVAHQEDEAAAAAGGGRKEYRCGEPDCLALKEDGEEDDDADEVAESGFVCFSAKLFAEHMVNIHGKKPFECQACGGRYMNKANLDDHILTRHSADGVPKVPCDICGKKFHTRSSLLVHRRDQHELGEKRLVKCDICDFVSKGMRNLRKHKEVHNEEASKKFQCSHCSRFFRNKSGLVVHERTHTGEAPYRCDLCQIHFKRLHHLYAHLKSGNHANRLNQMLAEGLPVPERCYSVNKEGRKKPRQPRAAAATNRRAAAPAADQSAPASPPPAQLTVGQLTVEGLDGEQIYIDIADEEVGRMPPPPPSAPPTLHQGQVELDLQNTVLLTAETDEYQQFLIK